MAPHKSDHVLRGPALSVRGQDGYTIITISGEIDIASAPVLREQLLGLLRPHASRIVVDLSGVTFCDASGLAVLVAASRRAGLLDGVLGLAAPAPLTATVLRLTSLDSRFEIFATVPEALAHPLTPGIRDADVPEPPAGWSAQPATGRQAVQAGGAGVGGAVMTAQQDAADERFCSCPAGRHWGPRGAAGILPYALARDGRAWVLLSHRSPARPARRHLVDVRRRHRRGRVRGRAAVRETCEEIRGITQDQAGIAWECVWECPQGCGWTYTTFVVRVPLHPGGSLPRARVARGRAAWETAGLAWVPASQVQVADRDLHPSFADVWPALREAISGPRFAKSLEH